MIDSRKEVYKNIPEHTIQTIDDYFKEGVPPGGFVTACLANDLMEALGRADENNRNAIFEIASYIYNEIPLSCHGSYDIVKTWIDKKNRELIKTE